MSSAEKAGLSDELRWTMTRIVKDGPQQRTENFLFDLRPLTKGYSLSFLAALKLAFIDRRNRVSLTSIQAEFSGLKSVLLVCQEAGAMTEVVEQIDLPFLAAVETIKQEMTKSGLRYLRLFFKENRGNDSIFAVDLRPEDFPRNGSAVGEAGEAIKRILSQALSRSAMAQCLSAVEDAYEAGHIDIGHYSFAMLAFQVFFRPGSYRQLRLSDVTPDENKSTGQVFWFVEMRPVKTGMDNPHRLSIKISADVGELLKLQQQHVVQQYGHLVAAADLGNLALFPARLLKADGTWRAVYANKHCGMLENSAGFTRAYLYPIKKLVGRYLSFNALRHTVGTQLALAGLSASSIAAVLRHATDRTCQRYVDLFFQGVLDRISENLQPSFDEHFPVYREIMDRAISKRDLIPTERAIVSEDLITGRREVTAECGRQSLCGYAPLACYDCKKFRPCWDADHTINLDVVNREIADFEGRGLAMQHEVQKYKLLRNAIRVVISICEMKSKSAEHGSSAGIRKWE